MMILNPIPGQETANSDFLLERGAAAKINRIEDLPFRLAELLSGEGLSELSLKAKALGRPLASDAVVAAVVSRLHG
jgi:processive 1,2-diacylglycerol beta-glucosyltransferase